MPERYVKKPVEIDAVEYTGNPKNQNELEMFVGEDIEFFSDICVISTLEGKMTTSLGDYIIKGVKGEFYPCKPDIFYQTYDRVE